MPKVSVIIPVYKAEKYIAQALNSVLEQTLQDYEILIIDDGSPDNSVAICQEFKDLRIKIFRQPNGGAAAARNRGINESRGDYIAFLDADDAWMPEKLAKQLTNLEHAPDIGVSFCRSLLVDLSGVTYHQKPQIQNIAALDILLRNPITHGSTPMIRRQVLEQIRFKDIVNQIEHKAYFDRSLASSEDYELWLRIALTTPWKIQGINDYLTLYRTHTDSLSSKTETLLSDHSQALEKIRTYAPEFIRRWEQAARAYFLFYLTRRAVRSRDPIAAMKYTKQSLRTNLHPLWFYPWVTFPTLGAVFLLQILPEKFYNALEKETINMTNKLFH